MSDDGHFFNLNDLSQGIARELAPGLKTRIFAGDQAMLSVVELEPFAEGKTHSHTQEQWGVLLRGDGVRVQGGKDHPVSEGDFRGDGAGTTFLERMIESDTGACASHPVLLLLGRCALNTDT